ncbi:hypothetical protein [Agromyces sp. NPDC055658]
MQPSSDNNSPLYQHLVDQMDEATRTRVELELARREHASLVKSGNPTFKPAGLTVIAHKEGPDPLAVFVASINGEPEPPGKFGVQIFDPVGGAVYTVLVNDTNEVTEVRVAADSGMTLADIKELPRDRITFIAREYVADKDGDLRQTKSRGSGPPALSYVASVARRARAAGVSPREALRDLTWASLSTVDRWLRDAREAGLLERDGRGRKKKTTTNGGTK